MHMKMKFLQDKNMEGFRRRFGWMGDSCGYYIWHRKRGTNDVRSVILSDMEFWDLITATAPPTLMKFFEGAGGPSQRAGGMRFPFRLASAQTKKAIEEVYRHAARTISDHIDAKDAFFLNHHSHSFAGPSRGWMVALDVFSIYRADFSFFRLCYPFAGVVMTLGDSAVDAPTQYDGSKGYALAHDEIASVEGGGGCWIIRLQTKELILDRHLGLIMRDSTT